MGKKIMLLTKHIKLILLLNLIIVNPKDKQLVHSIKYSYLDVKCLIASDNQKIEAGD